MLTMVRERMLKLHVKGHDYRLLASLPALVDNVGLVSNPEVLLRTGEHARPTVVDGHPVVRGVTCHALVIESGIAQPENALTRAQIEVLRLIGTEDYIQGLGAMAKDGRDWR